MSAQGRRDSLARSIDTSETRVPPSLARVSRSLPGHPSSRFGRYSGGLALVTAVPGKACFAGSWDEVEGVLCLVAMSAFGPKQTENIPCPTKMRPKRLFPSSS